jgi:hypothetical protein
MGRSRSDAALYVIWTRYGRGRSRNLLIHVQELIGRTLVREF